MIDHRTTSANHPQADGLAERCVQSVKTALAKCVLDRRSLLDWDTQLHWIALGYRASRQKASGLSPYAMLYGCEPCIPPAVKPRFQPGICLVFDTPDHREQAADYIVMRGQLLQQNCAVALGNLRTAQHRDTLRYRQVRSGLYRPSLFKFNAGEYVYVKRRNVSNTLMSEAQPGIFRILEVRDSGVLVLQGKCGSSMEVNQQNCAPCMLMNIDGRLDHSLRRPGVDEPCVVCDSAEDEAIMVMCDGCGKGYHTYCLVPPVSQVPVGLVWVCPKCEQQGVQIQALLEQRAAAAAADPVPDQALMFPNAAQRATDATIARMDGQEFMFECEGVWERGIMRFVHRQNRPAAFQRRPIHVADMPAGQQWHTEAAAKKLLKRGAEQGLIAAAAVSTPRLPDVPTAEPSTFTLSTVGGCRVAGQALFPGGVSSAEAASMQQLHTRVPSAADADGQELQGAEIRMLLHAVDLHACARLACPCDGWADVAKLQNVVLQRYAKAVTMGGTAHDPLRVVSPGFYQAVSRQTPLDWVFLSVPAGVQDVALAVAASNVAVGVSMLVRRAYLTTGPAYRRRLLQQYMDQGRLAVVSQEGTPMVWVCVFSTAGHLNSMCSLARIGAFCCILPAALGRP